MTRLDSAASLRYAQNDDGPGVAQSDAAAVLLADDVMEHVWHEVDE